MMSKNMPRLRLLGCALLALCASCTLAPEPVHNEGSEEGNRDDDSTQAATCKTDLTQALADLDVPGLSVAIVNGSDIVCTGVAGMANVEEGRAVSPDTVFAWASVSKAVTAAAVMTLVDEAGIDLDVDLNTFLSFPVRNPHCPDEPITLRHLLTHTSSIIDNDSLYYAHYTDGDSPISLERFVRGYLQPGGEYYDSEANFAKECPGTVNEYSNIAVGLLGRWVEEVAAKPFDTLCQDRIFGPLDMNESSFHLAGLSNSTLAVPYERGSGSGWQSLGHAGFPTYPDGLLRTSAPDLARFLSMMIEEGELDGQRILSLAAVEEMHKLQVPDLDDTQGLLWYYDYNDSLFGHDGSDPGTSSLMFFDPDDGVGVVMVANGDWYDDDDDSPGADALLSLLLAEARE